MLVVLDACVLYPPSLRDLLLTLGALDVIEVRWSEEILDEVTRNVVADHPDIDRDRFEQHTIAAMHRHFPEALVVVDADVISALDNDPKDRHVAAVAITAGAEAIVTFNIKDFGGDRLPTAGVKVLTPGALVDSLLEEIPEAVPMALSTIANRLRRPELSPSDLAHLLAAHPTLAAPMQRVLSMIEGL